MTIDVWLAGNTLGRRDSLCEITSEVDALRRGPHGAALALNGHDVSRLASHPPAAKAIQTKLAINQPGDQYEQEADRVADQVMTMPAHHAVSGTPTRIQRFSGPSNGLMDAAPASVDRTLASPGRPLVSTLVR